MWVLKPRIFSFNWASKPLMTLMTMISTATPSVTPSTEIKVITETNVLLGRRYRSASSSSNGNPDMRPNLDGGPRPVNQSRNHGCLQFFIPVLRSEIAEDGLHSSFFIRFQ